MARQACSVGDSWLTMSISWAREWATPDSGVPAKYVQSRYSLSSLALTIQTKPGPNIASAVSIISVRRVSRLEKELMISLRNSLDGEVFWGAIALKNS